MQALTRQAGESDLLWLRQNSLHRLIIAGGVIGFAWYTALAAPCAIRNSMFAPDSIHSPFTIHHSFGRRRMDVIMGGAL